MRDLRVHPTSSTSTVTVVEEENVATQVAVLVWTVVTVEGGGQATQQCRNNYNSHYPANENLSHIKRFSQREIFSFLTFNYFPFPLFALLFSNPVVPDISKIS